MLPIGWPFVHPESHIGGEPCWSHGPHLVAAAESPLVLLKAEKQYCYDPVARAMWCEWGEWHLFVFPSVLCATRRTGLCLSYILSSVLTVMCAVDRRSKWRLHKNPFNVLGTAYWGHVCPLLQCPPPRYAFSNCWGRKWAEGICFSGFLSLLFTFLKIYPFW